MTERSKTLRIFVSSPGDVVEERTLTKRVLQRLAGEFSGRITLEPIFWEHEPLLATDSFQKQIVRPSETDILVSILWSRLGTRLPVQFTRADGSRYSSGTEYEFEDAVASYKREGRPDLLVYRKTADPVVSLKDKKTLLDKLSQKEALDAFFSKWFHDEAEGTLIAAFHPFERSSDFEELLESHLKKLIERRLPEESSGAEARTAPIQWKEGSPFRGLHVFSFEHAPIFFGRTKAVGDVLNALRVQASEGCAFILVLGMSGGGKSSLVQAGVLPVLAQPGVIEGVGLWRHAIMRPGDSLGDVFHSLAASILQNEALPELKADNIDAAELAQLLRETPKAVVPLLKTGLSQAASELAKARAMAERPSARLALVVDQMEELFTLEKVTVAERARFVEALDVLARSGSVWVIATMRSDFYPRCAELEKLVVLKEGAGQYDLLPPTPAEIGQMIRQPALAAGLHFEEDPATKERLDEVLRDAAAKNPISLALLEFTLEELYKQRTERGILTHEAYRRLGGVEGALAQRGEEVYEGLEKDVQAALGPVFRELVGIGQGEDKTITRKYAPYDVITATPETRKFVETFIEARLFVTDLDVKGNAVVSVAHEALLKHWPRMKEWVEKNKETLRARSRVSVAASRWTEEGKSRDLLLAAGKPLAEAEELVRNPILELSGQEKAFIKASVAKKRRLWWMKRAVVAALAILTIITAGAAYLANKQRERAQIEAGTSTQVSNFLVNLFEVSDPDEAKGNTVTAREILDRGAEKIDKELADQPLTQARLQGTIGKVYDQLGLYQKSLLLHKKALDTRLKLLGNENLDVATSLNSVGDLYRKLGKNEEAEPFLIQALDVREKLLGPDHPDIAKSLNNLAVLYENTSRYTDAEPLYKRALAIQEKAHRPEYPDLAMSLTNLAILMARQGKYAEAEPIFKRVLSIDEKALGPDHPRVATDYNNLGIAYKLQKKYAEAEPLYQQALKIREKVLGANHPDLARSLNSLANVYLEQDRFRDAEPLYRRALKISEEALGLKHPDVALCLDNLGLLCAKEGRYTEAETHYRRALEIREKSYGPVHHFVGSSLHNLANLYRDQNRYREAEPLYRRSLSIYRKILDPKHPDLLDLIKDFAVYLRSTGREAEASALETEVGK